MYRIFSSHYNSPLLSITALHTKLLGWFRPPSCRGGRRRRLLSRSCAHLGSSSKSLILRNIAYNAEVIQTPCPNTPGVTLHDLLSPMAAFLRWVERLIRPQSSGSWGVRVGPKTVPGRQPARPSKLPRDHSSPRAPIETICPGITMLKSASPGR